MQWYPCFADISRVGYHAPVFVSSLRLPGKGSQPTIHKYGDHTMLNWPGDTSASPAGRWQSNLQRGESVGQHIIRQTHEALSLPGTPQDYHFILSRGYEGLWEQKKSEYWIMSELESMCWLDVKLVQVHPDFTRILSGPSIEREFIRIPAFSHLINLYECEGFLSEALNVAQIAIQFKQEMEGKQRILRRLTAVTDEDHQ